MRRIARIAAIAIFGIVGSLAPMTTPPAGAATLAIDTIVLGENVVTGTGSLATLQFSCTGAYFSTFTYSDATGTFAGRVFACGARGPSAPPELFHTSLRFDITNGTGRYTGASGVGRFDGLDLGLGLRVGTVQFDVHVP